MALQSEIVSALTYATSKGFQIHPDAFAMLQGLEIDVITTVQQIIKTKTQSSVIVVEDIKRLISPPVLADVIIEQNLKVLQDPTPVVTTGEGIDGFSLLFRSRFEKLMKILAQRPDSRRITKIESAKQAEPRKKSPFGREDEDGGKSTVVIAGLVMSRRSRKNGVEIEVDDYTGIMKAVALTEEAKKQVANLSLDQVVMLELEGGKGFQGPSIKSVTLPDIPDRIPGRSKSEAYAVLISDLHVGSKYFMQSEFLRLIEWLSSDDEIVRRIKFLCIGGDIIDGIGIFPNQDKELLEFDAGKQMNTAAGLLAKVPKHIKMIVIPGNHDPGRRALPQPSLPEKWSGGLRSLENCVMLGNPSMVELNGVKILMYHGQSLDDIIATVPGMNYHKPAAAMRVMLKARHLAPMYGSRTPLAPESEDMMVISEVPDVLHCGHVHVTDVESYRGTLVVNSGAWQRQTKFQQTMGITPSPGIAVLINLATLQPTLQDFN